MIRYHSFLLFPPRVLLTIKVSGLGVGNTFVLQLALLFHSLFMVMQLFRTDICRDYGYGQPNCTLGKDRNRKIHAHLLAMACIYTLAWDGVWHFFFWTDCGGSDGLIDPLHFAVKGADVELDLAIDLVSGMMVDSC